MDSLLEPRKTSYKNYPGLLKTQYFPPKGKYTWPSTSAEGFTLVDSTNLWKKYWGKYITESSKKKNLNWLHEGNCLHSIYMVLGMKSNLEMI